MGEYYFRFYTNRGQIVKTLGDTSAWTTPTAYVVGDFVQESSIIYYCIVAHTSGTFATDLGAGKWVAQSIYEVPHIYSEAEIKDVHYAGKDDTITFTHKDHAPQRLTRTSNISWTMEDYPYIGGAFQDTNTTATTLSASTVTKDAAVTVTASVATFTADDVGTYYSLGGEVTGVQGYFRIDGFTSTTIVTGVNMETLTTAAATTTWAAAAWGDRWGWPARVTYHERRLFFARTDTEPQKNWGSKAFVYDDFGINDAGDDQALAFQCSSDEANPIEWLHSATALGIGTYGGEFSAFSNRDSGILTPATVNAARQSPNGSEAIQPKSIGRNTYFVQRFAKKIREFFFFWEEDSYRAADATIYASHILGTGVVDMAVQQNPDQILWCVRADGQIATMVREIDQQMLAWSRQVTDGLYESIAIIPSNTSSYDEPWVIVKRTINGSDVRYIEYFEDPIFPDRQDKRFYVHSGLKYDAYELTTGNSLTLSAVTGTGITVTAGSAHFAIDDIGQRVRAIDSTGATVGELKITAYTSTTIVTGDVVYDFDSTTYSGEEWGVSVTTISGLDHLEAKDVTVYADGGDDGDGLKTVASGAITLNYNYFVMAIGLPYNATLVTLPPEGGSQLGSSMGKKKRYYQASLNVYDTLGLKMGKSLTELKALDQLKADRIMGTAPTLFSGVVQPLLFLGLQEYEPVIAVRQEKPFGFEIRNIIGFLDTEDI